MEYKDYYEVLGVPKTATQADIKKAYRGWPASSIRTRTRTPAAERRFKEANEAHAVLADAEKRKRYDELGANWQAYEQAGFGSGGGDRLGRLRRRAGRHPLVDTAASDPEELGGGFSDFFQAFFGGGGGASSLRRRSGRRLRRLRVRRSLGAWPVRGPPLRDGPSASAQATAEVTLAEVASGAERMVNVNGRRLQVKIPAGVSDGSKDPKLGRRRRMAATW